MQPKALHWLVIIWTVPFLNPTSYLSHSMWCIYLFIKNCLFHNFQTTLYACVVLLLNSICYSATHSKINKRTATLWLEKIEKITLSIVSIELDIRSSAWNEKCQLKYLKDFIKTNRLRPTDRNISKCPATIPEQCYPGEDII